MNIKLNEKYQSLITSPKEVRYTIITGGRGSSKSFSVSTIATLLTFERGHNILYTRYTMTSAHLSIIPEFLEKIELLGVSNQFNINKTDIENNLTGDKILLRGIKTSQGTNTANLKSLQGISTWCVDEAEEMTDEETFDKIDLSVRQQGVQNRVILIMNPATKEHWIYKRFFESRGVPPDFNGIHGDTNYIHTSYLDNIDNLSESFLNSIEVMRTTRPEKYQHQVLGSWLEQSEGVIFTNWKIGAFNNTIPSVFGNDFGYSLDPSSLIETVIDKKNKKIYLKEHYYKQAMTTTDVYEFNKRAAGDGLIIGDSAESRLIAEVKARGNNIKPAKKGPGSILAGINTMLDYELIIDPDSINLIKELNHYIWSDKKSGTPVDKYNHAIDSARYAISYQTENPTSGIYEIY